MATATEPKRHPGRRKQATQKVRDAHVKKIQEAEKKRRDFEQKAEKQVNVLAERIDKAARDGVETKDIADVLGISRQMVYKLVRERVDGKPLTKPKASSNGNGKKSATKAKANPLARGKRKTASKNGAKAAA